MVFDPTLPLERARTIPAAWYFDSEIHAAERQAVFGASWQCVGRTDQVAKPGEFLTADIAGEPILVVRGEDGVLRAFHNVCRHRGARVAIEPCGHATKLRCRYHGWTYDLTGRLRGVPEFGGVADFRREDHGLAVIMVDTWGPLVFVHAHRPAASLADFLAPLTARTAKQGLEKLRFAERKEYDLRCNWKVYVDNYLDGGYHVNTIHPGLAGALDYSGYHTVIDGETSVQISPLKAADASAVGAVRAGDNAYYWWLFPNFMINLYQGVMDTNLVLPLGPERCRVVFDFYFDGATDPQFIARSITVADQVQAEDMDICEDVQRGLASISYDTGRFSVRREAGGYHFHQLLARRLLERMKAER
jgi:choline monooxygenase